VYMHAPGTKPIAAIKPRTVGLTVGLTSLLFSIPVGALAFGLIGLIFKKGGRGALIGVGAGSLYSAFAGYKAAQLWKVGKSSGLLSKVDQMSLSQIDQLSLDSIDFSRSGLDSDSGITFHGMARSIAPL